jgi:3-oxoacyl-[acyl-carrier protein] reductase
MSAASARTALLTGAARGIGAAIAAALTECGIRIVSPSRQELDLADPASVDRFIAANSVVPVDILVNNAGINVIKPLEKIDDAVWDAMFQVDLRAPFQLLRAFAPQMKARGWGRVVNLSSVFSLVSRERRIAYTTMKSGLNGLTRAAAVELGPYGVLVNAVCPGYVETALTRENNSPAELEEIRATIPLRRLAQPAEIARFVAFLCSDDNTYITGQMLAIDGGFTCQ